MAEECVDVSESIELVRRAQRGDRDALGRLFERYYTRVRGVVRVRLGEPLREFLESGDIVQETFAQALASFDRFEVRDEARFLDWLSRLAENRIRDAAKLRIAQKRDPARAVALDDSRSGVESKRFDPLPSSPDLRPEDLAARGEENGILDDCVAGLDQRQREIVVQRNYLGATWPAIAEEFGYSNEQAARAAHAKATLELCLQLRARGVS
ncbi:MAG: RNA polymerase sigma factor [Planctomycetota bacterium]